MNTKDAVYYSGLILGTIVGVLGARAVGVENNLLSLLVGIGVGVCFGVAAERFYTGLKRSQ
jgi:hypothetical protein